MRNRLRQRLRGADGEEGNCSEGGSGVDFEIDMEVLSRASKTTPSSRSRYLPRIRGGSRPPDSSEPENMSIFSLDSEFGNGDDEDADDADDEQFLSDRSLGSFSSFSLLMPNRTLMFSILVGVLGAFSSTLFMGYGIDAAVQEQEQRFQLRASEIIADFQKAWREYETAGLWLHQACGLHPISGSDFKFIYDYLNSTVDVHAAEWIPIVQSADRVIFEEDARAFYAQRLPQHPYEGIVGYDPSVDPNEQTLQKQSAQPFYYPVQYVEPLDTNDVSILQDISLDLWSSDSFRQPIEMALLNYEPVISKSFPHSNQYDDEHDVFSEAIDDDGIELGIDDFVPKQAVRLFHPGIRLQGDFGSNVASLVIEINEVVQHAAKNLPEDISIYIYDMTNKNTDPVLLMATELHVPDADNRNETQMVFLPEVGLEQLIEETVVFKFEEDVMITNREWMLVVVALEDTFQPSITYIILTGKFILLSCLCVSLWLYTNLRKQRVLNELKRQRDGDKAAMVVQSARETAKAEQELNDYIAHEVRNPVAAALSACSFVKAAVNESNPMSDIASIIAVREDVEIIDSSLSFTNSLLRSMLDMHRAAAKKIMVEVIPVDVLKDVIEPVSAMLYTRDTSVEIQMDCSENVIVMSDRLRLKQIMLNLGRNAVNFVRTGFIRLGAEVIDGSVRVYVEDSGYGIPMQKRSNLFAKFQESLDILEQGTGMGLCLCKNMTKLLRAEIWLDEDYHSEVPGFPGCRFVVDLKTPLVTEAQYLTSVTTSDAYGSNDPPRHVMIADETYEDLQGEASVRKNSRVIKQEATESEGEEPKELPEDLSVLFVDDDMMLRKLFMRSLKRIAPKSWNIQEAANGETCLNMVENQYFDLIFMDQYMASVEKQLLGTETVRALRSKNVKSRICGLSANDMEHEFRRAGADMFLLKPFPCKPDILKAEMIKFLDQPRNSTRVRERTTNHGSSDASGRTQSTSVVDGSTETR